MLEEEGREGGGGGGGTSSIGCLSFKVYVSTELHVGRGGSDQLVSLAAGELDELCCLGVVLADPRAVGAHHHPRLHWPTITGDLILTTSD